MDAPCLKCLSARFVIDIERVFTGRAGEPVTGLKCLSARFVIDIPQTRPQTRLRPTRLKCLSARFVIDIKGGIAGAGTEADGLKCLSARFVIDIKGTDKNGHEYEFVSQMPFG